MEGYYAVELDAGGVGGFLSGLAAHLGLRTYGQPVVYSPGGAGREVNQGYDAFVPLVDSGIAGYFWSQTRFCSLVIYSCKHFKVWWALEFTRRTLEVGDELVHQSF